MRKIFYALALGSLSLLLSAGLAQAKTPDGQTPSEETICDDQIGAAFGLCTAYCEAMDCDSDAPHASPTACSRVRAQFERVTGQPLPCEATCPCVEVLPLFQAFVNGAAEPAVCQEDSFFTTLVTPDDEFIVVDSGTAPPTCGQNFEPPIEITAAEALVCRQLLRDAAAARGMACVFPE